ncbi:MAG: CHAT domain-containing protein [Leptolyngbyaceae cyanobacterium bins.302]|nr:CHAT domain-containing protein [Leptolyngbyaceae cyanobacterium bins.302]
MGKQWYGSLLLVSLLWLGGVSSQNAIAQPITPAIDGTETTATPVGNQINITGGQFSKDRANLFHSFERFGLSAEQVANFLANPSLQNILGRVIGGEPSVINGRIQVTDGSPNLYLMNPAGIIFGTTASLNVPASFYATTANRIGIGNQWFNTIGSNDYVNLVGNPDRFAFTTNQPGAIINAGNLAVNSGQTLALLGGTVISTGTLTAPDGQIAIASVPGSNLVRIQQSGSLLSLEFSPISPTSTLPTPPSLPQLLTGGNLSNATGLTVNRAGQVVLTRSGVQIPTDSGVAIASGKLDTSGQTGGSITVVGDRVGIVGATLNASGTQAGGTVRIGGDYQGKGTLYNASQTHVSQDSTIQANAIQQGNGGRVIIWADKSTSFAGNIQAQGGTTGGDGGFVEVSGKETLTYRGNVDTRAVQGQPGTLLLDPTNITVINGGGGADDAQLADGQILQNDGLPASFTISENALEAIAGNTNILLQATNDIIINDLADNALTFQGGTGTISLEAGNQFLMNTGDSLVGGGRNLSISASTVALESIANGGGSVTIENLQGGLSFTGEINTSAFMNGDAGVVTITALNDITLNCPGQCINSSAGIPGAGGSQNSANIMITSHEGRVEIRGANSPTLNATNFGDGPRAGDVEITAKGDIITSNILVPHTNNGIGGNIILISEQGSVDTTLGTNNVSFGQPGVSSISTGNGNGGVPSTTVAGKVEIRASKDIRIGNINATGQISGGDIILESSSGTINTSTGLLSSSATGTGKSGTITLISQGNTTTGNISSASRNGSGGNIILQSLNGQVDTRGGLIDSNSRSSDAGNITITAQSHIFSNNLIAFSAIPNGINGGRITLTSQDGSISSIGDLDTGGLNGNGGEIKLQARGDITVKNTFSYSLGGMSGTGGNLSLISTNGNVTATGRLNAVSVKGTGGSIEITGNNISLNGQVTLGSETGKGGKPLILNASGQVSLPNRVQTNGADIIGLAPISQIIGAASINTSGGSITIPLSTSFTLTPAITLNTDGGDITITTPGTLAIATPLNTGSTVRKGGTITLAANTLAVDAPLTTTSTVANGGNIILNSSDTLNVTAPLTTTSTVATSGSIQLTSDNGGVFATNLTTAGNSGNTVFVQAATEIRTGQINTSATNGDGGNVILDPPGNVEVAWINTQAPNGRGGFVDITTGQFFIASDTFPALNGLTASISTIGGTGGGNVTIRHDGGARLVNFNIGNLLPERLRNGTAGAITTGAFTLNLGESYPGPFTLGNIQLITSPRFALIPEARPAKVLELNQEGTLFPLEELYTREFEEFDNRQGETAVLTLEEMQDTLQQVEDGTGVKPALIYVGFAAVPASTPTDCEPGKPTPDPANPGKTKPCECKPVQLPDDPDGWSKNVLEHEPSPCDRLTLTLVTSKGKPVYVPLSQVPRHRILISANQFRKTIETKNSSFDSYQPLGNQLYQWLVKPLRAALQEREIQNLSFLMPAQLRLLPLAALIDDNEKFLAETYSSGLMPSLSLVDTRKVEIKPTQILAMGASEFKTDQGQAPLKFAEQEIQAIVPDLWRGRLFLNQDFTFNNLAIPRRTSPYGIAHFATHGQFGTPFAKGMIQLWDQKITPDEIRQLEWSKPPLELLVLSACRTAYGDRASELGFAGAASRVGVKSIVGSLWFVGDNSSMELMKGFYKQLKIAPIKADALAEAQKEMIKASSLSHPYHWSAFTMVGNPW